MDCQDFLDRIVAPGNFIAVATKPPDRGLFHRFFKRDNIKGAARFIEWASHKRRWETWYAPASYKEAELRADDKYQGHRTQANVEALRCFWFDADIARPGDGKDPARVFSDQAEVIRWFKSFSTSTGVPVPNLWVCSGYGLHVYWTLKAALDRLSWQSYADALKAALIAHGARGDASVVADSARILRPVTTWNYKDPGKPVPCFELVPQRLTQPDRVNAAFLGTIAALPHYKVVSPTAGLAGKPAAALVNTGMTSNAKLDTQPRDFAQIAANCGQVGRSLAEGGAHDGRQLWLPLVTLARFCFDGRAWAHKIGHAHPAYTEANTDRVYDQTEAEYKAKGFGAPLCKTFDAERPGVCDTCPHKGQIQSPYSLGFVPPVAISFDLPSGFRRRNGTIERSDGVKWVKVISGNVINPTLERVDKHLRLGFDYVARNLEITRVFVEDTDIEVKTAKRIFSCQGVVLDLYNGATFGQMILAWIDQLLKAGKVTVAVSPFGWHDRGISIGGMSYCFDGSEQETGGGDPTLIGYYQPRGSFEEWQKAAELVIDQKPELQLAFAAAFGAPLMPFTGESGLSLNFVGPSGCGKSSAFRAGAAVWGLPSKTMMQLEDTPLSISMRIGEIKNFPGYWDEAIVNDRYKAAQLKDLVHKITQGRDKSRLTADIKMREMGAWQTIFPFSSNDPLTDVMSNLLGNNSATLLRMLEIPVDIPLPTPNVGIRVLIRGLDDNYGHAGRRFIQAVITQVGKLPAIVQRFEQRLITATQADNDERFYTAGGAAILAGAWIADRLKLVRNLDLPAMENVLAKAIIAARDVRTNYAPSDPLTLAGKTLENFCNDNVGCRLVTRSIPTSGAAVLAAGGQHKFVIQPPIKDPPLAFQIGVDDKIMRINWKLWSDWCLQRGLSPQMLDKTVWQLARFPRGKLGANTAWMSERMRVIELNLALPELSHFVADYPPPAQAGGNVVALPQRP